MRYVLSLVIALSIAGGVSVAQEWPGYRGPNDDGVAAAMPLENLALTPVWKVSMGDAFGQIAVVDGKALLMAERGTDEYCFCLDAATGKDIWAARIDKSIKDGSGGNGPRSTPAIDGGRVYVLSTYLKLACLDLATGNVVWKHDLAAEMGGKALQWGSASSPVVINDLVLVTGGAAGKGISAFDKETGQLAWAKTNEKYTYATPTVATIKGKIQAICFMESGLVSVDPANGAVLWTFPHRFSTATAASPVVGGPDGDIVYCSAGYGVGAAACQVSTDGNRWTAKMLWETPGKNLSHWSTPVYYNGCIYGLFGHNDNNGPLACLDIATGQVKWSQKGFGSQGGLIVVGDKLLVLTPKGELVLVAASNAAYKELGRVNILPAKDWTAPTLVNGMIYARNSSSDRNESEVVCLKVGQ